MDADAEAASDLVERYEVQGYPTFIVTNERGDSIDRWWGYDSVDSFVAELEQAKADPTTVEEKIARFEAQPSEEDAATLGSVFATRGQPAKATVYYRRAQQLAADGPEAYAMPVFTHSCSAYIKDEKFSLEEVRAAADAVFRTDPPEATDRLAVAYRMADLAQREGDPSLLEPYAAPALEASAEEDDPRVNGFRREVRIAKALQLDEDVETAVALKQAAMPEDWQSDASELNTFAWWCFQNEIHLEQAERLARKGVELAEDATEKAMVLDTVAEICNLRGQCDQAVELITRAVEQDPENEHYQEQLTRFRQRAEDGCV